MGKSDRACFYDVMTVRIEFFEYFFEMLEQAGYKSVDGLQMCELGNQHIAETTIEFLKANGMPPFKTGKEYFLHVGFDHTSIDINGKDGALPIDLAKPIPDTVFDARFDIVTNFGVSEHVLNQFECFKNIHNLCKTDGLIIHIVPHLSYKNRIIATGRILQHGNYNYTFDFFCDLANICEYTILDRRMLIRGLVAVAMVKTKDNDFISEEQFNQLHIDSV